MNEDVGTMKAAIIDRFGGPEELKVERLPIPQPEPGEVVIRVEWAGVGEWDPFEREGGYAEMLGLTPHFPYVLGSEGSGRIAAIGEGVSDHRQGDQVYAAGFLNPRGGFYAEYVAIDGSLVVPIPPRLSMAEAGVIAGAGTTALRGLEDTLSLKSGESVMIFGAGGGIGHVAVQLAKRMGARVLAVASGSDGVELAMRLGADAAIDGRASDVVPAAREFAPEGLDAALLTAGGPAAARSLAAMREEGRVAYPFGIKPEAPAWRNIEGYNGDPDRDILERLSGWLTVGDWGVHVAQSFPLEEAADAHVALGRHYLGKVALRIV